MAKKRSKTLNPSIRTPRGELWPFLHFFCICFTVCRDALNRVHRARSRGLAVRAAAFCAVRGAFWCRWIMCGTSLPYTSSPDVLVSVGLDFFECLLPARSLPGFWEGFPRGAVYEILRGMFQGVGTEMEGSSMAWLHPSPWHQKLGSVVGTTSVVPRPLTHGNRGVISALFLENKRVNYAKYEHERYIPPLWHTCSRRSTSMLGPPMRTMPVLLLRSGSCCYPLPPLLGPAGATRTRPSTPW